MASKMKPISSIDSDKSWQAEDDLRTLIRAEQIRADPKRLAAAKKKAKERQSELSALDELAK